jgi:negative regulator of genetic competence, sporulation and motility
MLDHVVRNSLGRCDLRDRTVESDECLYDQRRREDLVALLNEFDRLGLAPAGAATFNVDRLRRELGVSS